MQHCPTCGEARYKVNHNRRKKIPHKVLRHFPLVPRLQRLFVSVGIEFLKRKLMNARASEIQFMKPINSKKNNKHASHGKGENKLTFVEPILLPSFVTPQNLPRYSPSKESQRVVGFCNFGEGRSF